MILTTIDPDVFQSLALKWIGVIATVLTAALIALGALWSKMLDLRDRADRQSLKTGSLQEQVTSVALQTPPQPSNVTK